MSDLNLSQLVWLATLLAIIVWTTWRVFRPGSDKQRQGMEGSFGIGLMFLLLAVGDQLRDLAALGSDWPLVFVGGFNLGQAVTLWQQRRTAAQAPKSGGPTG